MTPRARKPKPQAAPLVEWEERGDSPVLGGLFLVGMLGQWPDLQLRDLSTAILNAAVYESNAGRALSRPIFI